MMMQIVLKHNIANINGQQAIQKGSLKGGLPLINTQRVTFMKKVVSIGS